MEGATEDDLSITVTFDRAAAWQLDLATGAAWARVTINVPAASYAIETISSSKLATYIDVALGALSKLAPKRYSCVRVAIRGPDSPGNELEIRQWLLSCYQQWSAQHSAPGQAKVPAPTPAPTPVPAPAREPGSSKAAPSFAGVPAYGDGTTTRGPSGPMYNSKEWKPTPDPVHPQEALIQQMCRTVRQHVTMHGAAPPFRDSGTAARGRAHNYIRSVTAAQTASEEIVEEVRIRLAA